ncbi:hypothetical protein ISS05_05675, partial [Candidatus Woesearchaeota archaeon]|nr:hypothetical protein [Candidatus Woesearchaeota archaeon]
MKAKKNKKIQQMWDVLLIAISVIAVFSVASFIELPKAAEETNPFGMSAVSGMATGM